MMFPRFPVLRFPVPRFQRPRGGVLVDESSRSQPSCESLVAALSVSSLSSWLPESSQFSDAPSYETFPAEAPVELELGSDDVEPVEAAINARYSISVISMPLKMFAMPFLRRCNRLVSVTAILSLVHLVLLRMHLHYTHTTAAERHCNLLCDTL